MIAGQNYVDNVALRIYQATNGGEGEPSERDWPLYRSYAVLALSSGVRTDNQMVHDAWSAWQAGRGEHKSLIPFEMLEPEVQDLDTPYRDAIRMVAKQIAAERALDLADYAAHQVSKVTPKPPGMDEERRLRQLLAVSYEMMLQFADLIANEGHCPDCGGWLGLSRGPDQPG